MSEIDDLADMVDIPARGARSANRMRNAIKYLRGKGYGRGPTITSRVKVSAHSRKAPVTLAKVSLPE